ncbi:(R)-mandelonitrile lyase [Amphibiibacter pelophylacis]|uniref:Cupin domain-containing protein n=1 Tax=Amphibiibacter pelophylacis TaxID=1799477 RepID=A0ACC6P146_9BURK
MTTNSDPITIRPASERTAGPGPADYFTGSVQVEMLFTPTGPDRAAAANVTFQPGARTAWHTHPLGQTLIVTAGVGRIQSRGGPVRALNVGDVVRIPPHLEHWHGAETDQAMTHIAIQEELDGRAADWLEPVQGE